MKKILRLCSIVVILSGAVACASSPNSNDDILTTTDIEKIENFLKTAHPEDPRRMVLKPKLVSLKNQAWTKGRETHKPMAARVEAKEEVIIPTITALDNNSHEAEEFKKLIQDNANKGKTVKLLNQMFDNDPKSKESFVSVQNTFDCNIILRIRGRKEYNLPIPAKGENSIVIEKGNYLFSANICGSKYSSTKNITKGMMIVLKGRG